MVALLLRSRAACDFRRGLLICLTCNSVPANLCSPQDLEQELQYFKVPLCPFKTCTPGVESVSAQEKTVDGIVPVLSPPRQPIWRCPDHSLELAHILYAY